MEKYIHTPDGEFKSTNPYVLGANLQIIGTDDESGLGDAFLHATGTITERCLKYQESEERYLKERGLDVVYADWTMANGQGHYGVAYIQKRYIKVL